MITADAGEIFVKKFLWWDAITHVGYGQWDHKLINTFDDADFVYDFRGGPEFMGIAARLGISWSHDIFDEFQGDSSLLESASVVGTLQSNVSSGTNITIQLGSGEAANFTEGNFYFFYDFRFLNADDAINYVKVTDVDTYSDQLVVEEMNSSRLAGSVISAYAHRFASLGSVPPSGSVPNKGRLPYVSYQADLANPERIMTVNFTTRGILMQLTYEVPYITGMDAEDLGRYAVQRPGVQEINNGRDFTGDSVDMNRGYGTLKGSWVTSNANIAQMLDGRLINNLQYIYAEIETTINTLGTASVVVLIPDFDSIT